MDKVLRLSLHRFFQILVSLLFAVISISCVRSLPSPSASPTDGREIDPIFLNYYNYLGGEEVLGPPISPVFEQDGIRFQYTTAALMIYDPQALPSRRFRLAPLGLEMDIDTSGGALPGQPQGRYVDGRLIYPDFVPLFDRLGGKRVAGRPLTEPRYNPERKRLEQFFENVGFYIADEDPTQTVRLLAYGAWRCDISCRSAPVLNSIIDAPRVAQGPQTTAEAGAYQFPQPPEESVEPLSLNGENCCRALAPMVARFLLLHNGFSTAASRLGPDFTGFPLSDIYLAPDGWLEQIYENVVLGADPAAPETVTLRPITDRLNIRASELEPPEQRELMSFFPLEPGKGIHVASYFLHYLNLHGGYQTSGAPRTSLTILEESVYWQCFENLCLQENRNTPEGLLIRPVALGYLYKELYLPAEVNWVGKKPEGNQLTMQVWEANPRVASIQEQIVRVSVQENGLPKSGVQPTLILNLPDGSQATLSFPATDMDGMSILRLMPIEAAEGALIPYQVCITNISGDTFCVKDSYLIWNTP